MQFIYQFTAYTTENELIDGNIPADDHDVAFTKLKRIGLRPNKIVFDVTATAKSMFSPEFDLRDLVRFYNSLGDRINTGRGDLVDGLRGAVEFVFDKNLKTAIMIMANRIGAGDKIHDSLTYAGFPKIDAMTIRSAEMAGSHGNAFKRLAEEHAKTRALAGEVKKVFLMPIVTMFVIYLGICAAPYYFGLGSEKFITEFNGDKAQFEWYFSVAHFSHEHLFMYLALATVPILALSWAYQAKMLSMAMSYWPLWNKITYLKDMAATWTAFASMYDAGVPPYECASLVIDAAVREDTKHCFKRLEGAILSGKTINVATKQAGFSPQVYKGVRAAEDGGGVNIGLKAMASDFNNDASTLVEVLKVKADLLSKLMTFIGVLFLAYVVLGPSYLSAMKML